MDWFMGDRPHKLRLDTWNIPYHKGRQSLSFGEGILGL